MKLFVVLFAISTSEKNKLLHNPMVDRMIKPVEQWTSTLKKPTPEEIQAFVDELQGNTACCHTSTKTFTNGDKKTQTKKTTFTEDNFSSLPKDNRHEDQNSAVDTTQLSSNNAQPPLIAFMSYSVPKAVWQGLWQESQRLKQPIQFVIRGLPNNSFPTLAQKIMEYGCPVNIDPVLFDRYHITAVPAFLVRKKRKETHTTTAQKQDHGHRDTSISPEKIYYGNVSLAYVIAQGQACVGEKTTNTINTNHLEKK